MQQLVIDVTPDRWASQGEAEATFKGRVVRIWSGIPGERSLVRVVHRGQHQDVGAWQEAWAADPHRVAPRCDRYHLCGGCPLMHLDGEGQRAAKRRMMQDALASEGLGHLDVLPVVPSPTGDDDFRHIIKLGVGLSDHGHLRVGAWGRNTRTIVPIPGCTVAAPILRKVTAAVSQAARHQRIEPFDPSTNRGVIRAIVARASRATGEVLVTLVAGRRNRSLEAMADDILTECREVVGVALHLNDDPGNAIFFRDEDGRVPFQVLGGRATIEEDLGGFRVPIGPGDFFQTHPAMAEVVYADVIRRLGLAPGEPVVDLYSGVGLLTMMAAKATGWALGVEEIDGAVQAGRAAAKAHGVAAEFVVGRVEDELEGLRVRLADARPIIIVDPARRGLEPGVIDGILALRPRRMAYISCNPRALARDLAKLVAGGMEAGAISLYDMFPNTAHTEALVILRSPDAEGLVRRAPQRKRLGGAG